MEPRIHMITLAVDDLERALAFYRDGLGLLSPGQEFGVETYATCVSGAAASLAERGLISPELQEWYRSEAAHGGLGPLRIPGGQSVTQQ